MRLLLALALICAAPASSDDGIELDERETHLGLRALSNVFVTYWEATGEYPSTVEGELKQVGRDVKETLGEPYSRYVPERDGWGNPYRFSVRDDNLLILSCGPNGVVDYPAATLELLKDRVGIVYRAASIDGDDVILVGGVIAKKTPGHRQRQKQTAADMRALGTALVSYRHDNGVMPGPTKGFVRVVEISDYLEPVYIKEAPVRDAWETELLLWCGTQDCVVVSLGADREPDRRYYQMNEPLSEIHLVGEFTSPDSDMILLNDRFIAFPVGMSE
jgi:hypothetical protein